MLSAYTPKRSREEPGLPRGLCGGRKAAGCFAQPASPRSVRTPSLRRAAELAWNCTQLPGGEARCTLLSVHVCPHVHACLSCLHGTSASHHRHGPARARPHADRRLVMLSGACALVHTSASQFLVLEDLEGNLLCFLGAGCCFQFVCIFLLFCASK